jgi:hypothetical protein
MQGFDVDFKENLRAGLVARRFVNLGKIYCLNGILAKARRFTQIGQWVDPLGAFRPEVSNTEDVHDVQLLAGNRGFESGNADANGN